MGDAVREQSFKQQPIAIYVKRMEPNGMQMEPKTIAGEPLHGWSGHFKKFMAQLRLSLIGSMEEDIILRSQLSFESAFII